MARKYSINSGHRSHAVRVGMERGVYEFLLDYALESGMSLSAAGRRLILLGARCEAEHGKVRMPLSFAQLNKPQSEIDFYLSNELEP